MWLHIWTASTQNLKKCAWKKKAWFWWTMNLVLHFEHILYQMNCKSAFPLTITHNLNLTCHWRYYMEISLQIKIQIWLSRNFRNNNMQYWEFTWIPCKGCSIKTYEVPREGTLIFGQPPKEAIYWFWWPPTEAFFSKIQPPIEFFFWIKRILQNQINLYYEICLGNCKNKGIQSSIRDTRLL
jgi:hypothetical protein